MTKNLVEFNFKKKNENEDHLSLSKKIVTFPSDCNSASSIIIMCLEIRGTIFL